MSFNNVVGGKLKLKGKALDVKGGGTKKKKSKRKESFQEKLLLEQQQQQETTGDITGEDIRASDVEDETSPRGRRGDDEEEQGGGGEGEGDGHSQQTNYQDHRTPAEKKYDEQRTRLEMKRLAKVASKSHRQKIEEFNQYLANLSEHYDIPKVGPG